MMLEFSNGGLLICNDLLRSLGLTGVISMALRCSPETATASKQIDELELSSPTKITSPPRTQRLKPRAITSERREDPIEKTPKKPNRETGRETKRPNLPKPSPSIENSDLEKLVAAIPKCDPNISNCFGLILHVVMIKGKPVQDSKWLQSQIRETKRLFRPVGIEFEVAQVWAESDRFARMDTREQRDAIGDSSANAGFIDVYMVERLADVDKIGEQIRGVHWRRRNDISRRWIIISKIAMPGVLSHELGHFFGLPHSSYVESMMNKRPRKAPKWSERVFARPELAIIESHRDRMIASGRLRNRSRKLRE